MKCFICNSEIKFEEKLNMVECECPNCGKYAYEKNFITTYEYYLSVNGTHRKEAINTFLSEYTKNHHVCFVDDFESSLVEGYDLLELRDVLNMVGLEFTHNNTIDSNWTD